MTRGSVVLMCHFLHVGVMSGRRADTHTHAHTGLQGNTVMSEQAADS